MKRDIIEMKDSDKFENKLPFIGRETVINSIIQHIGEYANESHQNTSNTIMISGISGIGKTEILTHAMKQIELDYQYNYIPNIYIDCVQLSDEKNSLLEKLVYEIESNIDEKIFNNYRKCKGLLAQADDPKKILKDLSIDGIIPDVIEGISLFFGGTIVSKLLKYGSQGILNFLDASHDNNSKKLNAIDFLLAAFINDISNIENRNKIIIFLDAVENIKGNNKDLNWLIGKDGICNKTPNIMWIIAGQDEYEDSIKIIPLAKEQYICYFEQKILNSENSEKVLDQIVRYTQGIPYILEYCYQQLNNFEFQNILSESSENYMPNVLVEKCVRRYRLQYLKILGIVATLGNWSDECFEFIMKKVRSQDILRWNIENDWEEHYAELCRTSMVRNNKINHSFYDEVKMIYQNLLSIEDKRIILGYAAEYFIVQLNNMENTMIYRCDEIVLESYSWLLFIDNNPSNDYKIECKIIDVIIKGINLAYIQKGIYSYYEICFQVLIKALTWGYSQSKICELPLNEMLMYSNNYYYFERKSIILKVQADIYMKNGNTAQMWAKLLCARKSGIRTPSNMRRKEEKEYETLFPFHIDKDNLGDIVESMKNIVDFFDRAEIMNMAAIEFSSFSYGDCIKEQEYWSMLEDSVRGILDDNHVSKQRKIVFLICFWDTINYSLIHGYYKELIDIKFVDNIEDYLVSVEQEIPGIILGEYYYQKALFAQYKKDTLNALVFYENAIDLEIENVHHEMWCHRASVGLMSYKALHDVDTINSFMTHVCYIVNSHVEISYETHITYLLLYFAFNIQVNGKRGVEIDGYVKEELDYAIDTNLMLGRHELNFKLVVDSIKKICFYYIKIDDKESSLKWVTLFLKEQKKICKNIEYYIDRIFFEGNKVILLYHCFGSDCEELQNCLDEFYSTFYTARGLDKNIECEVSIILDRVNKVKQKLSVDLIS